MLPDNVQIGKDAKAAFSRSAGIFIMYVYPCHVLLSFIALPILVLRTECACVRSYGLRMPLPSCHKQPTGAELHSTTTAVVAAVAAAVLSN